MGEAPPIMEHYPLFKPIEITDPMPATLEDVRTLDFDWSDVSSEGLRCFGALRDAWLQKYGDVVGHDGPVLDDPEAIAFALRVGGNVVGAGVLYNIEKTLTDGRLDVVADFLVAGPPEVAAILVARAEGATAISEDPDHEVQSVVVHLRSS